MKEQKDRYEIFLKVCETGSFSGAAEALNYTQSGISQMMAGLEEELEVRLFARVKKGVILTDNGARLIPYIQEMVNQKAKLRQAAFNINHKIEGKLRVGSFSSITALWMPGVIHFFKEHYPKVQVEIFDGNYDEIRDWIIHGQVDCGFLSSIVADDMVTPRVNWARYRLSPIGRISQALVAVPKKTGRSPVAIGSSVPACPIFRVWVMPRSLATTSKEVNS